MKKTSAKRAPAKKAPKRRCLKFDIHRFGDDWVWDLLTWNGKVIATSVKTFRTAAAAIKETDRLIDETVGATQYVNGVELGADEK